MEASRSVVSSVLAACFALTIVPLGCGAAQDDYVVVPRGASEEPRQSAIPEAAVQRMKACLDQGAARLTQSSFALSYHVAIDERGEVLQIKRRDSTLADVPTTSCIEQAIRTMTVNVQALPLRSSRPIFWGRADNAAGACAAR